MPSYRANASRAVAKPIPPRFERKPNRVAPELSGHAAEAVERAREALLLLQGLQRRTKWHPTWSQILAHDYQQARAMLSKAEATYEGWKRGLEWACIDQMVADYDKFSQFVRDLYERGDWRERERRPKRSGR